MGLGSDPHVPTLFSFSHTFGVTDVQTCPRSRFSWAGLASALWRSSLFNHLDSSQHRRHRRAVAQTSRSPEELWGQSWCFEGIYQGVRRWVSVLAGLPAAAVQNDKTGPELHGWRKRMLWDEDRPHRLHQRPRLLKWQARLSW